MKGLKPCPFCGSVDVEYDSDGGFVVCQNEKDCGAMGPSSDGEPPFMAGADADEDEATRRSAVEKWNRRAKVPEPPEIKCELCAPESAENAVYEAWLRKRDPFLGTPTGHLIKVYICEEHKAHPFLCANEGKPSG